MCQYAFSDAPGYQLNQVGKMPPQLFRKLMDEIPGHPIITFTGGEPLLHPDMADFVAYAKRYGRFCTLTTNGWVLEKRARELCEAGLDVLVVSVDGPREIHNRVRGGKSFERLSAGLEAMLAQPRRPLTFVSMAISDLNHDQLMPMYELARSWGVDGINFNHLWMQPHEMVEAYNAQFSIFAADEVAWDIHPEKVDAEQVARALDTIRQRTRFSSLIVTQTPDLSRNDIGVWYREPERFIKYNSTRCAWTRMKVWPDGGVKPCREWGAGNVGQNHAMEVWNGEKFREFRRLLATHGTLPICARCCYTAHR
jgi:MoaA/NifB/PqqE/SkfB family radical SAM enzyme